MYSSILHIIDEDSFMVEVRFDATKHQPVLDFTFHHEATSYEKLKELSL